jgi:peptidoglycan/xylan/chitin deacetylase (PgdA/CDA1 family)
MNMSDAAMIPHVTNDFLHKYFLKALLPFVLYDRYVVNGTWNEERAVCISFDCDTDQDMISVPSLLTTLRDMGIRCSFALVGTLASNYPDVVKEIARNGCEIVNHTFSHPKDLNSVDNETLIHEVEFFQNLLTEKFDYRPEGFRAPHLLRTYNKYLFRVLQQHGLYDSSYVGSGASTVNGIIEVPLTSCPEHPQLCFDYWHHFQIPVRSSSEKFLQLWESLLTNESLVNIYLDPHLTSKFFLEDVVTRVPSNFTFLQMKDIAKRVR